MEILVKKYIETNYDTWSGKVCAQIFVGGCDFRCPFCNTPDLVLNWRKLPDIKFSEILKNLKKRKKWIDAVEITGGEPSLHKADVIEMLNELKAEDFLTKVSTNGFDPDFIEELNKLKLVDYWAIDIKAPLDQYKKVTGIDVKPETMRRTIKLIIESRVDYEFSTTVIPGLHDKFQIFRLAQEIRGARRYILQNFRPKNTLDPHYEKVKPFTQKQMQDMKEQAKQFIKNVEIR